MNRMRLIVVFVILFVFQCNISHSVRILGLFPANVKSHSFMINPILEELIARGHQLDVITPYPLLSNNSNYTLIDISPGYNYWTDLMQFMGLSSGAELSSLTFLEYKKLYHFAGKVMTEYALKHPSVQEFLHAKKMQYDLILVEHWYQDAFLMLAHELKAPVVGICMPTLWFNSNIDSILGSFGAWSHVPHELSTLPDTMTYWQRLQNIYYGLSDKYSRHFEYFPQQQALADKYFSYLPKPVPTVEELSQSVSVIIQNSYSPIQSIKPNVPGLVDVGGIHIKPVKLLPNDLRTFIDEAPKGVIYFSFGTVMKSTEIPKEVVSAFVQMFKELSGIHVLWKMDSDDVDGMPNNVLTRKWMPQNDILADPNVKLFITHGGLFGSQEGLYHGVPMLGIPLFLDQHINTANAEQRGYALKLQFENITVENLRWAFSELLHNPSFAKNAKKYSRIFRERPESPMDTAMYWIEYVIKFRGADHLRSVGRDLSWYSYFLLDVAAGVFLAVILLFIGIWISIRIILRNIWKYQKKIKFDKKYK